MAAQLTDTAVNYYGTTKSIHDMLSDIQDRLDGIIIHQEEVNQLVSNYFTENNITEGDGDDAALIVNQYYEDNGDTTTVPDIDTINNLVDEYKTDNNMDPADPLDQEAIQTIVYKYINNDPNNPTTGFEVATNNDVVALLKKLFPDRDFSDLENNGG